jgi:hypothetical protein
MGGKGVTISAPHAGNGNTDSHLEDCCISLSNIPILSKLWHFPFRPYLTTFVNPLFELLFLGSFHY